MLYTNIIPFYVIDLSICRYWYPGGLLKTMTLDTSDSYSVYIYRAQYNVMITVHIVGWSGSSI
jgi:hypothetical protein